MKKKKLSILILGIFFASLILSATPACAEEKKYTTADADTYVDDRYPTTNFGYSQSLIVCISTAIFIGYVAEAYLYFNLAGKPDSWMKVEIEITLFVKSAEPFDVILYLITEEWDEYTLTWNNKPSGGENIITLNIHDSFKIFFDISDYVRGDGMSICLKVASDEGLMHAYSKESSHPYPPQLIWTYEEEKINGYNILLLILGTIGVVFIIYRKHTQE